MKKRGGRAAGGWSESLPRHGGRREDMLTEEAVSRLDYRVAPGYLCMYVHAPVAEGLERGTDSMTGTQTMDASFSGSNL